MTAILPLVLLLLSSTSLLGQNISRGYTLTLALAHSITLDLLSLLFRCRTNEIQKCGSTCIETCTYTPTVCPLICSYGCFCADGYVRQSNATDSPCVKRSECGTVSVCGENEEYSTCADTCPAVCDDLRYPLPRPAKACIALCRAGCQCKKGFYRAENGKCVAPQQCCGSNERYQACGAPCVETCSGKPAMCITPCVPGCFCGCSDFVRQNGTANSPCIHRDDCAEECADDG